MNIGNGPLPTRVTDTSATIIDHVITKESPENFKMSLIISDISDYRVMILKQTGSTVCRDVVEQKIVTNKIINYPAIVQDLKNFVSNSADVDEMLNELQTGIGNAVDRNSYLKENKAQTSATMGKPTFYRPGQTKKQALRSLQEALGPPQHDL